MATRLFFHALANSGTGTFPTGEQGLLTPTYTATNANTLRRMDGTAGTLQTSLAGTSTAATSQVGFYGFFSSGTFTSNQSVGGGGQTLTLNIANQESSSSMNVGTDLRAAVYVWRPSTGAKVGDVCATVAMAGVAEPGAFNSERVNQGTTTVTTLVNALAGDVLICEVWQVHTQATSLAFTGTFFYDGTTQNTTVNAVVTTQASFMDLSSDTLTFNTFPVLSNGTFTQTLAAETLAATGKVLVQGAFSQTLAAFTLAANGANPIKTGNFLQTLAAEILSASGKVLVQGGFSQTLTAETLSATGSLIVAGNFAANLVPETLSATGSGDAVIAGTFSNSLADFTLNASANLIIGGNFTQTLAAETLSSSGTFIINGGFVQTLANESLNASGSVLISGGFSANLAAFSLAASGKLILQGNFSTSLADLALNATGVVQNVIVGNFNTTLADESLNAVGTQTITYSGTFSTTLASFLFSSSGTVAAPIVSKGNFATSLADFTVVALGSQAQPSNSQSGGGGGGRDYGFISPKSSNRSFKNLLDKEFKPKKHANPVIKSISITKPSTPPIIEHETPDLMLLLLAVI